MAVLLRITSFSIHQQPRFARYDKMEGRFDVCKRIVSTHRNEFQVLSTSWLCVSPETCRTQSALVGAARLNITTRVMNCIDS